MRVVTTPMCEEIVKLAGIGEYNVNKFPTKDDGDLAILLSESKTDLDSIYLKLNTFKQIKKSVEMVAERCNTTPEELSFDDCPMAEKYLENVPKSTIKIKVHSNFLKDIVEDMGFEVADEDYDYIVAPDYLIEKIGDNDKPVIEIPSHGAVSLNPISRACERYKILEDFINK